MSSTPASLAPESFSRFVLPFAYALTPASGANCQHRWVRLKEENEVWRRQYFTAETAHMLFDRARWYRLDGPPLSVGNTQPADPQTFCEFEATFRCTMSTLSVRLLRPRLVLFEYPHDSGAAPGEVFRTGFLIVDAQLRPVNGSAPSLEHLLEFNEVFRYWRYSYDYHLTHHYWPLLRGCPVGPLSAPRPIERAGPEMDVFLDRWLPYLRVPVDDGAVVQLFSDKMSEAGRAYARNATEPPGWVVHADNRTYVWSAALFPEDVTPEEAPLLFSRPHTCASWVRLLNVDLPKDEPLTAFERRWTRARTYGRWIEAGSLYGFATHAGVMLGSGEKPYRRHFRDLYFDQALLLLYLRTTTFRFARRLAELTESMRDRPNDTRDAEQHSRLRRDFAIFTNLYRFPLLSNQQQAIEMYSLARRHMDVEELFLEAEKKIDATDRYLSGVDVQYQARVTAALTVGLGFAGILTLALIAEEAFTRWWEHGAWSGVWGGAGKAFGFWGVGWLVFFFITMRWGSRSRWLRRRFGMDSNG